eukprot:TRINITY_DN5117_c1_g2_i1.p1 TRINITY_DN5117_c1_g2~~TRINITY_DN5117_c1_g2_i1.p1  ORF type:complete len:293 (-),score=24.18 TRINITY_DN5117_c1_g2_i1:611-1489(-)
MGKKQKNWHCFLNSFFVIMLILLSPAKTMDMSEIDLSKVDVTTPKFIKEMDDILKIMQKKSVKELADLFKSNNNIAKLNYERYSKWDELPSKPAGFAFQGQAYKPLDFITLDEDTQKFAQQHLRILCGLYGVLRPFDSIKAYRLEMGSKLNTSKGDLYAYWKDIVTKQLTEELQEFPEEQRFIVNCASKEYYDVVDFEKLNTPVYNVNFRGATVHIKMARGAIVRYILENKIVDPKKIQKFEDGWTFDEETSQEYELEFHRSVQNTQSRKRKQEGKVITQNKKSRTRSKKDH